MKKIAIIVCVLSCAKADLLFADTTSNMIPSATPGFGITFTALYLQPSASGGNLNYAVYTSPLPVVSPSWQQQSLKPNYQPTFDLGLQYTLADGVDQLLADWLYFNSNTDASITSDGSHSVAPPYAFGPGAQVSGGSASSNAHFQLNNVNMVFNHLMNVSSNLQVGLFGGLSAAYVKENINSTYTGTVAGTDVPPAYSTDYVMNSNNTSEFTGLGPRLGLTAAYYFTPHFDVVGELGGSLLVGNTHTQTDFTETTTNDGSSTTTSTQLANQTVRQVVPEVDSKLGLAYSIPFNDKGSVLSLETGYRVSMYINGITQVNPTEMVPNTGDHGIIAITASQQTSSDFGLNGPYASVNWAF